MAIKDFKFFTKNKPSKRIRARRSHGGRDPFSHYSYYVAGEEKVYIFVWSDNDTITNTYRTCIYQGFIKDFEETYDNMIIQDHEILFLFPTFEYISIHRTDHIVRDGFNCQFIDPYEVVTISFKVYNNENI